MQTTVFHISLYFLLFLFELRYLDYSTIRHMIGILYNTRIILHNIGPQGLSPVKAKCNLCQSFSFLDSMSSFRTYNLIIYRVWLKRSCSSFLCLFFRSSSRSLLLCNRLRLFNNFRSNNFCHSIFLRNHSCGIFSNNTIRQSDRNGWFLYLFISNFLCWRWRYSVK